MNKQRGLRAEMMIFEDIAATYCAICDLNPIPQSRITYPNEPCLCNYCSMITFGKKGVDYNGVEDCKLPNDKFFGDITFGEALQESLKQERVQKRLDDLDTLFKEIDETEFITTSEQRKKELKKLRGHEEV